jgi:hypothetical protein
MIQKEIKQADVHIIDSLLWARDLKFETSFPDVIEELEERSATGEVCLWPPEVLAPALHEEVLDCGGDEEQRTYPTP